MKNAPIIGLVVLSALTHSATAASIVWDNAVATSTSTEVITTGTLVFARQASTQNADTSTNPSQTVNGVTFSNSANTQNGVTFTNTFVGVHQFQFMGSKVLSGPDGTAEGRMLQGAFDNGGNSTITLNGLTVGQQYLIQIWANDFRSFPNVRNETVTGSGSDTNVQTLHYLDNGGSGLGQGDWVSGTFTADGTGSQTFTFTTTGADSQTMLNAFQLRSIPEPSAALLGGLGLLGLLRRRR